MVIETLELQQNCKSSFKNIKKKMKISFVINLELSDEHDEKINSLNNRSRKMKLWQKREDGLKAPSIA